MDLYIPHERRFMTNAEYIRKVMLMTFSELFEEVMSSPEFLTDGYYRPLGKALNKRYEELSRVTKLSTQPDARPVAWMHSVENDDGDQDYVLSFAPDNFPLKGVAGFKSLHVQPLYAAAQPAPQPLTDVPTTYKGQG